jgi:hypothetical protein
MIFRVPTSASIAALALSVVAACAAESGVVAVPRALDPLDFYPLRVGNAWSYDVDTGEPSTTLAVTRVEAFDGTIAELRTGESVVRYQVGSDGIRLPGSDAWLIRAPIRVGATWPAPGGRSAELVSTRAVSETPAGRFDDCLEVLEVGGKLDLEVRTVYCRSIGPTTVTSTMRSKRSARSLTVAARLRGYEVSPQASGP